MHVRDAPGREAEVAEDDILDAWLEEVTSERDGLDRVLVEEVQDHGQIVDTERPERVLVRSDAAEVLPIAVDAEDLSELSTLHELLQLLDARVIQEQVAGHEDEVTVVRDRHELVDLRARHRRGLLDEDVLAGLESELGERKVRRHRRGYHDRVERRIREHLLEGLGPARLRIPRLELTALSIRGIAEPGEVRQVGEVPREVLPPVAQACLANAGGHSFQTLSERLPFCPVALRRSTTSTASSTRAS